MNKTYQILPPKGLVRIDLGELWRFRELFFVFVWRDFKVRYKQTALGILWAIFQPFVTMLIFSIFFGKLAQLPSDDIPYPIFVYSGLLFWNYFVSALSNASNSLVDNENIVKKIYFPRLILPISTLVTPIIDFVCAFVVLLGIMLYYHYTPSVLGIALIPILLLFSLLSASGLGVLFASVNVKFRDIRFILPFFIQLLLFLTPVIYPISLIPQPYQWILYINPMSSVITVARSFLIGGASVQPSLIMLSVAVTAIFVFVGIIYFRSTERLITDAL
jgi:lipopolysaccharide transport system permease protein